MKIYHTETQADYDVLMIELEEKGCKWFDGKKPTAVNLWSMWKETTCLRVDNYVIFNDSLDCYREKYPNENIIEYKAKGTKMTQEEIKQKLQVVAKLHEVAFDISVAIGTFARGTLTVESNLSEAKSSAKKLIEKIDEYLESQEPEFKVGDYVVDDGSYLIMKVDEVSNSVVCGKICYNFRYFRVRINFVCETGYLRLATPEEILEYESALNFYKHGREPFEVKKRDLIRAPSGKNHLVCNPKNFTKTEFLDWGWEFLKTAEEVNEWLGAGNE